MRLINLRVDLRHLVPPTVALLVLGACGSGSASESSPLTVSFTTRAAASTSETAAATNQGSEEDSVILTKAQLVLREIELKRTSNGNCETSGDDSSGTDDCFEIELGPVLIDLPLNDQAQSRFHVPVPNGAYREFELRIDKPENDSAGRSFVLEHPLLRDASVLAEGTFRGRTFRYAARARARLEFEFRPAFIIDESGSNITVRVHVGRWFRTADGSAIDPSTAQDGGPNSELVLRNIAASIQAFADGDRDGDAR